MPLQALTRELVEEIARQYPALQSLNLSQNALREVEHLALLPSLLRVDLSGNRLRAFPAPQAFGACCARLEFLDLSANAIESLSHAAACVNLRALDIGANQIELFSELRFLQPLEHLEALTLEGNPIAQHATYRREVLAVLPQLKSLDGSEVTPAERLHLRVYRKSELQNSFPSPVVPAPIQTQASSPSAATIDRIHPSVADAAVSPVSSSRLLTPDSINRQRNQESQRIARSPATKGPDIYAELDREEPSQVQSLHVDIAAGAMTPTRSRPVAKQDAKSRHPHKPAARPDTIPTKHSQIVTVETTAAGEQSRLLQSRVAALESILSIQDKVIQRGLVEIGRAQASDSESMSEVPGAIENAAQLYAQLLSTWREKVVSLMVQMKSMDLGRNDARREFQRQAETIEAARVRLEQERELWKQKSADAEAQRDLERVRVQESQKQCTVAETKAVSAVRTLSLEREKLQQVATAVAFFSARDGLMVDKMESLYAVARRLEAFERRLHFLGERITTASSLLAHREARLRNSEAAIDAERRIWHHRLEQMKGKRSLGDTKSGSFGLSIGDDKSKLRRSGNGAWRFLRPTTEAALRELFQHLDPYDTGLVKAQALLDALRADVSVLNAIGGQAKHETLVSHVEKAIRQRSVFGTVGGNITWGELLLFFMPESSEESKALHWNDDEHSNDSSVVNVKSAGDASLPPPFQSNGKATVFTASNSQRRLEKKMLDSMSREELVKQVLFLQDDRNQLSKRVLEDARELRRRAGSIQNEWKEKAEQLVEKNEQLQRGFNQQQQAAQRLTTELELAERNHGEAKHQLESFRRELLLKESAFNRAKEEMETQHTESLLREQEIWRKELQDVNFSHSLLKTEHQKQELHIRQLERELSKRNDALVANETQKIMHLEDKLQKRDAEIAKLRRERNTILGTLREHELKLALQRAVVTVPAGTQTDKEKAVAPPTRDHESVGCQTAASDRSQLVCPSDLRMSIDEIAVPEKVVPNKPPQQITQDEISRRLRELQSLTESLLDD